jgi:hypothetical protein
MRRRRGKTRAGDQCRNNAIPGTDFCYVRAHVAPGQPIYKRVLNFLANRYLESVFTIAGLILALIMLGFYFQDRMHSATSGSLTPLVDESGIYLSVGKTRVILAPSAKGVFLTDHEEPVLTIQGAGGKMLVSTNIRGEKGDLIAELRDNEWTHQLRPAIFDRNYTDHVLEIRDSRGKVALQVVDFGRTIHVAGIFRCKNGWKVALGPWSNGAVFDIRPPYAELKYEIPAICQYPSDSNLGVCPGVESLKASVLPEGQAMLLTAPINICTATQ